MAQPTPYEIIQDFSQDEANSVAGRSTVLTAALDAELANIQTTITETLYNLALIQRDDGLIANDSVGIDQLKKEISIGINAVSNWAAITVYKLRSSVWESNALYYCIVDHTSGVFADDLAAGKWSLVMDLNPMLVAAQTSADNSANSATSSANSATDSANSATAAQTAQTAAEQALDDFDDRYLGSKATAPTVDNDGNPLITGAIFWNSTNNELQFYNGAAWDTPVSKSTAKFFRYTATADQTVFSGLDLDGSGLSYVPGFILVSVNGSTLDNSVITATDGTSITLTARTAGDQVQILAFGTYDVANIINATQSTDGLMSAGDKIILDGLSSSSDEFLINNVLNHPIKAVSAVDNNWVDVCWSPSLHLYVAVAETGVGNRVMTSTNGVTWTARTTPADNNWRKVVWAEGLGLFVAVATSGVLNRVMTSPDGVTWTIRTTPAGDDNWESLEWSEEMGRLCAGATGLYSGTQMMYSDDGITWNTSNSFGNLWYRAMAYSPTLGVNGRFIATSITGSDLYYSDDGTNWTNAGSWSSSDDAIDACWSPDLELFVVVAQSGSPRVHTSPDGINWTEGSFYPNGLPKEQPSHHSVCWNSGLKCFISTSIFSDRAAYSVDGFNWYNAFLPGLTSLKGICYSPELRQTVVVRSAGTGDRVLVFM